MKLSKLALTLGLGLATAVALANNPPQNLDEAKAIQEQFDALQKELDVLKANQVVTFQKFIGSLQAVAQLSNPNFNQQYAQSLIDYAEAIRKVKRERIAAAHTSGEFHDSVDVRVYQQYLNDLKNEILPVLNDLRSPQGAPTSVNAAKVASIYEKYAKILTDELHKISEGEASDDITRLKTELLKFPESLKTSGVVAGEASRDFKRAAVIPKEQEELKTQFAGSEPTTEENQLADTYIESVPVNTAIFRNYLGLNKAKADIDALEKEVGQQDGEIASNYREILVNRANIVKNSEKITQNMMDIAQNRAEIAKLDLGVKQNRVDIAKLRQDYKQGIAQVVAMASVDFGKIKARTIKVGAAVGHYHGKNALALGVAASPTDKLLINSKLAVGVGAGNNLTFGLGATYEFGY